MLKRSLRYWVWFYNNVWNSPGAHILFSLVTQYGTVDRWWSLMTVMIRILRSDKGFNAFQMIKEFTNREWNKRTLNRSIQKIDATGALIRKRRESVRTARTPANIIRVSELIDDHGTSKSQKDYLISHFSTQLFFWLFDLIFVIKLFTLSSIC